jgi:predicted ArsR family transcriptional regulator
MKFPLNWKAVRVLDVVDQYGGEATTSEVRELVDFDTVLYHARTLAEKGLLEICGEVKQKKGRRPAKKLRLTDKGRKAISEGLTERVRPTRVSKRMNVLEADLDTLKDEFQQRDFDSVRDKVEDLRQEMEIVKKDIQKRATEDRIESLVNRLEGIEEDIEILFTRLEKRAKQQRVDDLEEYLEKKQEFNRNVLEGLARAASARAGDHENQFVALSTLIQYLVALERYYKIQGVNIWQHHPSNSDQGEEDQKRDDEGGDDE